MIYHLADAADWRAEPARPYAPASLAGEGFVHCSPDEPTLLTVADALYRDHPGPLVVLGLDEAALRAELRWEPPAPLTDAVPDGTLFPHLYGPINRDAVVAVLEPTRDASGRFTGLAPADR